MKKKEKGICEILATMILISICLINTVATVNWVSGVSEKYMNIKKIEITNYWNMTNWNQTDTHGMLTSKVATHENDMADWYSAKTSSISVLGSFISKSIPSYGSVRTKVLGTYSAELRDATKHIDIPRMINTLKKMHANTYDYPIGHQPTDWEDLPSFLRATGEEGINVRVVISAPLSANRPGPSPYAYDYVRWAHELATLSLAYSNLKAMIIDDFIYVINPPLGSSGDPNGLFTVDYTSQIYNAKNAVNPNFKLLIGAYTVGVDFGGAVTPELIEAYGRYIDGIWVAHWNTEVADLQYQLQRIKDLLGSKQLQVVIYANWPEIWGGPFEEARREPTPKYVSDCLTIAYEYADGVSTYCLPLSADDPFYLTLYPIVSDLYDRLSSQ